jgi:hypothetical protein
MSRSTALVLGGIFFVVTAICVIGGYLAITSEENEGSFGGGPTFSLPAESTAASIEENGPFLLPDASGGTRDIILQHLGDDVEEGWLAFEARPPGTDRDCFAEWQPEAEVFEDTCTHETFPADGEGLVQYEAVVEDDEVVVDLRETVG